MISNQIPEIHLVIGARPNYIKANPVYHALAELNRFDLKLINTGQHYDHNMSTLFFDELNMKSPDINLEVGSYSHGVQTAKIMERYEKILMEAPPNLVIVFGDINSTIACALAAVKLHIPAAHVEAGLRSFDRSMPEEINRILTDQISELLFITSPEAETNLNNEGVSNNIHFVGNTMIDSLVAFTDRFDASAIKDQLKLDRSYTLMTFHRPSNVDENENLKNLVRALEKVSETLDCVFPIHPRTKNKLDDCGFLNRLQLNPRFHILDPIGYIDFMRLQKDASVILTDSGGLQEESTFFGVPCLTVRNNTERPVTITHGTNKLIGTKYANIPNEVEQVISMPVERTTRPEFWDGKAAKRIAEILRDNLILFNSLL